MHTSSPQHRFAFAPLATALLIGFVAVVPGCRRGGGSERVQLVAADEPLGPGTTFELRFDQPVAKPGDLGKPLATSPLVIRPAVKGTFVWLSQRSGVFTPSEALRLDTQYHFTLTSGLTDADGRPLAARLDETRRTPGLDVRLLEASNYAVSRSNASAVPHLILEFNSAVQAPSLERYLHFRRPGGGERRASVEQGTPELLRTWSGWWSSPTPPWEARLLTAPALPSGLPLAVPVLPSEPPESQPYANVVCIRPEAPLDVGEGWELHIARGLPGVTSGLRLHEDRVVPIGTVQPFVWQEVEPLNALRLGRRLQLTFSKVLSRQITADTITNWVRVMPAPDDLFFEVSGNTVLARGRFPLEQLVQVMVKAGLPAEEPFELVGDWTNAVRFQPVPARLYFPEFDTDQYAGGRREFPLLAVNVTQAVVRAKLIDAEGVVHALRGYAAQHRRPWDSDVRDEPYQEVPYALMPGRTVFDRAMAIADHLDEPQRVGLRWDELLGGGRRGVVFLEADQDPGSTFRATRQGVQAIVQLTDLGFITKSCPDEVVALAFSLASGRAVPGAMVRLLTEENEMLAQARTDTDGLVRLPQTLRTNAAVRFDWRYQGLALDTPRPVGDWLVAQTDDDLRATDLREVGIPSSFGERPWLWSALHTRWHLLAFTDRPAYRPQETVKLKVIAREWRDSDWQLPAGQLVKIELSDPRGRQVLSTNLPLSDLASLDCSFALPVAPLGDYRFTVSGGDGTASAELTVQEFKPNAFEITLGGKPAYGAEEAPAVPVAARYLLGQPLSRAKVVWTLRGNDEVPMPERFGDFHFGTRVWVSELGYQAGSFVDTGTTNLTADLVLAPEVAINAGAPAPRQCALLVEITDQNQQTVSRQTEFVRHSSDFYLGLRLPAEVVRAGRPVSVRIAGMGTDQQPWAAGVPVRLTLKRVKWNPVRVESAGGAIAYRNDAEILNVAERSAATEELELAGDRWEPKGPGTVEMTPEEPGTYVLEARAVDAADRPVFTAVQFSVYGQEAVGWAYRTETQADLVADQSSYAPGQTARILVKTPLTGLALVSVERERVLRAWVTNLSGGAPVIEIPVLPADAPNVQVSVVQIRGGEASSRAIKEPEFRAGGVQLVVERPDRKLGVVATASAAEFRPGTEVRLETRITDSAGGPVENAEVTLFAVDEGILSLTGYEAPDPFAHFNAARAVEVVTGITLSKLMAEDPEHWRFGNKGFLVGGGSGRGLVRRNFLPLAYWNASLRTDAAGWVRCAFRAPDSLTRYRVVAVAHTARHQFGRSETAFAVNKPLMVEPALSRFANVGDRLVARAVVLNRTDAAGEVEVTVTADDKVRNGDGAPGLAPQRVTVPAQGTVPVDWPVEFTEAGETVWVWRARFIGGAAESGAGRDFTDAVESRLPVGYPAPLLREVHVSRVLSGESNLLTQVNPQLLEGRGQARVAVANTRLIELAEAAQYLVRYPYGCTEQLTSTLLPLLALRRHPEALAGVVTNASVLDSMIRAGLQRLLARQDYSGGFTYWPGGSADPWVTAYASVAVMLARAQGFAIPERSISDLLTRLRQQVVQEPAGPALPIIRTLDPTWDAEAQCLALYSLALGGKPESAYHEVLANRLPDLSLSARSWLALAIVESQGPADLALQILNSPVALANSGPGRYGSEASELGTQLLAWTRARPADPAVDRLATELLAARVNGHWESTQGDAWAVLGLSAYAGEVESTREPGTGTLTWGTRQEFAFTTTPETHGFVFPLDAALGRQPLTLAWSKSQPVFAELRLEARPTVMQQPRQERGWSIRREYQRLNETNGVVSLDGLQVGDRVLVTLTVESRATGYHVVVDDALPAVLEAINPAFKSQATAADPLTRDWVSDYRELRNDRVLFFARELSPGSCVVRYLARVRVAGTALAPSAKVEEMYRPARFGLTETTVLTARAL